LEPSSPTMKLMRQHQISEIVEQLNKQNPQPRIQQPIVGAHPNVRTDGMQVPRILQPINCIPHQFPTVFSAPVFPISPQSDNPEMFTLVPVQDQPVMAEISPETENHIQRFDQYFCDSNIHEVAENTDEFTEIMCPLTNRLYQIKKDVLSKVLEENGQIANHCRADSPEVKKAIMKFCNPKTLMFTKDADAQLIIDSGYPVEPINVKHTGRALDGKFECRFCPLIQNQRKFFPVKENLKRHYCKHLNYNRYRCPNCDYASYRNDHVKDHIEKKHPGSTSDVIEVDHARLWFAPNFVKFDSLFIDIYNMYC